MVSVADPKAIRTIYGFSTRFQKSHMYSVFRPYARSKVIVGMAAQQDEEHHKILRQPFAAIYSTSSLESMEHLVIETVDLFICKLEEISEVHHVLDLGLWLQLCVWDVLCNITFSQRFGFLDSGKDVGGLLKSIWKQFEEGAPISQMPWYDYVWRKNPILLKIFPTFRMTPIVPFSISQIKQREDQMKGRAAKDDPHNDILARFRAAKEQDDSIPDWALLTWTLGGLGAGGDTSVNLIRALFLHLMNHPQSFQRLRRDLETARDSRHQLCWSKIRNIPFFDACVMEAARLHPSIGLPLERIVPVGGTTVCGEHFLEGTVIGMNAWVVNRDFQMFGPDPDVWRPERWLVKKEKRVKMEQSLLSFGAGHRICPGQQLFGLLVSNLVVRFLETFDLELADPVTQPKIENFWLVRHTNLMVKLKKR